MVRGTKLSSAVHLVDAANAACTVEHVVVLVLTLHGGAGSRLRPDSERDNRCDEEMHEERMQTGRLSMRPIALAGTNSAADSSSSMSRPSLQPDGPQ